MSRVFFIALLGVFLAGCQSMGANRPHRASDSAPLATVGYAGGDGSSVENAIEIAGVHKDLQATRAEYAWARIHLPGCRLLHQSIVQPGNGKMYDRLDFDVPNIGRRTVYFDISHTFGKM